MFENVTMVGAQMNVAVTCPICGLVFDATGGGDGTFSTVSGRFRRVREAADVLAGLAEDRLRELAEQVAAVQRGDATPDQVASAADDEQIRRFWDVLPRKRADLYAVLLLLATVINVILTHLPGGDTTITPDVIRQVVDQLERHEEQHDDPTPSPSGQRPADPSTGLGTPTAPSPPP